MMNRKTEYILPPLREKVDQYSYANKQSIGKGFSSSVFKGRDDHTDEQVAIKVIDMKAMKGEVHKNLLAGQIEILNLIKHKPNVLDVHKICADKNKTYIITDYCQGGDLSKFIKSKKKISEEEAIRIIKQVIKGYQSLYSLGVVHRDLKPANIFFHNSKTEIGDFGFAVKQENLKVTQRYNVGSPVYMPPEALASNKYSHKSDIWAIGVIFYEMLMGCTPWTGRTQTELKAKMKTISIRNIMPPSISKASIVFLKKALEIDPKKRMDAWQLFEHFYISHEHCQDKDNYLSEKNNKLFRSMRKETKATGFDQTRGDSMKKTSTALNNKKSNKPEFMQTANYNLSAPKTALQTKNQKEYMSAIQKRMISKQLLSQVHFCRFLYKLIANIDVGLCYQFDQGVRDKLISLLFYKLMETNQLKLVAADSVEEYAEFNDRKKLEKLVEEYLAKYKKRLRFSNQGAVPSAYTPNMYIAIIDELSQQIVKMFEIVQGARQPSFMVKQIVVLDYLITLYQLLGLLKEQNLSDFHSKSKIQAIVDGEPIEEVSSEHVRMIGNKLRALRMI